MCTMWYFFQDNLTIVFLISSICSFSTFIFYMYPVLSSAPHQRVYMYNQMSNCATYQNPTHQSHDPVFSIVEHLPRQPDSIEYFFKCFF